MNKKHTFAILLFFSCIFLSFGQNLRSSVVLVKPKLTDDAKSGLIKIAAKLDDQGYTDLSNYLKNMAEGGHGSGVIVRDANSKNYLITNRHVASFSETADISFNYLDGTKQEWQNCKIVYIDPLVDLAVIEIPSGKTDFKALKLQTVVNEGDAVWSAGYPGLFDKPEWQLASGNITNGHVIEKDMGYESDSVYYQHSATIDPGNSGGPLVTGEPSKLETVSVVGINTWYATNRKNAFFSVPAYKIAEMLKRFNESSNNKLSEIALSFRDNLNTKEWDKFSYRNFISYKYATLKGWDKFNNGTRSMSTKDRATWYDNFVYSPLDTLSQYLSFELWTKVHNSKGDLGFKSLNGESTPNPYVLYSLDDSTIKVEWALESGIWKVTNVIYNYDAEHPEGKELSNLNKYQAPGVSGFGDLVPIGESFRIAVAPTFGDAWNTKPNLDIFLQGELKSANNFTTFFRLGFTQDSPTKSDYGTHPIVDKYNMLELGVGSNYYFTSYKPDSYIAPYIGGSANLAISLPTFQSELYTTAFTQNGSNIDEQDHTTSDINTICRTSTFVALVLEPKTGIEISLDRTFAFGAEAGIRYFIFSRPGFKSFTLGIFLKSTTLN